jgi:hypothetical protein
MPDTHWLKWAEDMERMDLKENYKQCAIKFARCAAMVEHRSKHGEEFLCYPEKPLSLYDYTHCSIVRGLHQNIEKWCKYYKEK